MKLRFLKGKPPQQWSDEELVTAFRKGGSDVYFNEIFSRYYPLVYASCLGLTSDREDSKDLTLIVFAKAYEQLSQQQILRLSSWLFTLARNETLTFLRGGRRNANAQKKWWETQKNDENWMENEAFRRLIYEEELEKDRLYQEGLLNLLPEQRRSLELFVQQAMSYREIAEATNQTVEQVKSHLQHARRRLKKWVSEHQDKKL